MRKTVTYSLIILAYVNLVPYVCRMWRGFDFVAQYLPDKGHLISGICFFGGFASLPAIPLFVVFLCRKNIPITFVTSIIVATALLVFWNYDYDLATDAQAAAGLIFIPLYAATITGVIAAITGSIEFLIRRRNKVNP